MSITKDDLISVAAQLCSGQTEREWRSAASRAYYGMYHKALQTADACLPPSGVALGEHEKLTERLKQQGLKGASLAYVLIAHKKVRTRADYFLALDFKQHEASGLIAACPTFFAQADAFHAHVVAQAATKP